eukprot:1693901-Pyramimonas_sp.AAC.1
MPNEWDRGIEDCQTRDEAMPPRVDEEVQVLGPAEQGSLPAPRSGICLAWHLQWPTLPGA